MIFLFQIFHQNIFQKNWNLLDYFSVQISPKYFVGKITILQSNYFIQKMEFSTKNTFWKKMEFWNSVYKLTMRNCCAKISLLFRLRLVADSNDVVCKLFGAWQVKKKSFLSTWQGPIPFFARHVVNYCRTHFTLTKHISQDELWNVKGIKIIKIILRLNFD